MHFPLKQLAAATLFAASLSAIATPAFANISAEQSTAILKSFNETSVTDFRGFLGTLAKGDLGKTADVGPAISAFLDNKTLSADQQNEINRLLGIYTRVKYGKAATETLRELVEIPTFNIDGVPQYKNPEFLKIAAKIQDLAKAFNLNFRNIDNRVYEISLEGASDEVVGIHAHADVVPVTPENWVLKDDVFESPLRGLDNVILTPHIGGSTAEAQANIGLEVAEKLVKYSDNGTSVSSVNFPEVALPAHPGKHRLLHIHENIPGVMSEINKVFAENGINISGQFLQTNEKVGYVVIDVDAESSDLAQEKLQSINGTIRCRVLF